MSIITSFFGTKICRNMNPQTEIISFMDLLDLDEEVIDSRLEVIMQRSAHTNKHLANAIQLLQYKQMINVQENDDCDNEVECAFVAKLLSNWNSENIDNICKIINIVLALNTSTLVSKSEHLIQQILSTIDLPSQHSESSDEEVEKEYSHKTYFCLKVCKSVLDAVIQNEKKLTVPLLDTPLENILFSSDERLKVFFLTEVVPRLFEGIVGYNVLERIWNFLKQNQDGREGNALKILSCLAEFYLPVPDNQGVVKFESEIVLYYEFWSILLHGLMTNDPSARKLSVYLMKRAIDSLITLKRDVQVSSETRNLFSWLLIHEKTYKENWNNFFILIDSLEEKQSNIVLPSLQLFGSLPIVGTCWMTCAYSIGLKHDNTQVRLKCIEHRLNTKLDNQTDALVLLEALNDINLYDNQDECNKLKSKICDFFKDVTNFVYTLKFIPKVKWSPVPLHHISELLAAQNVDLSSSIESSSLLDIVVDILKIPCNNIPIRNVITVNVTYFVGQCCKGLNWKDLITIYSLVKWNYITSTKKNTNPFIGNIRNLKLSPTDKTQFFKVVMESYLNIDFGLCYLETHATDVDVFVDLVVEKLKTIQEVVVRHYCNKTECFHDVVYIAHLFKKSKENNKESMVQLLSREYKNIMQYVFSLLSSDTSITLEETNLVFKSFDIMNDAIDDVKVNELLLHMYKGSSMFLKIVNADLEKKLLAINIIKSLTHKINAYFKQELLSLEQILELNKDLKFKDSRNADDDGRYRNSFYEKSCQIVYDYITNHIAEQNKSEIKRNLPELIIYIENVIECGGHGCLKWILKIVNLIFNEILDESLKFNATLFIGRMWKEIEELKSNNQYSPCMEEFVKLITQDALLKQAMYNNMVILYCSKIIEYATLKSSPLYYLVNTLSKKHISENFGQIISVFCDILLFAPVPKKDQRVAENIAIQITKNPKCNFNKKGTETYFNFSIQYTAILTLSKIKCPEVFETIASFIVNKIEDHLKSKHRYHGNSQSHRMLLAGFQHLLFLPLLNVKVLESEVISSWIIDTLGRLPHQPSVKICLEWFIALYIYVKNHSLNEELVENLKCKNVPITSQFIILYWIMSRKIKEGSYSQDDYEFVMDFFLSHTMGQMFNVRLHAQYLATQLYNKIEDDSEKYAYTIEIIQNTFKQSCKDKNFVKLKEDFFVKDFDIVEHAVPSFIYYFLPRYCDVDGHEDVDENSIRKILAQVHEIIEDTDINNDFKENWLLLHRTDDEVFHYNMSRFTENKDIETLDCMGTIQKKYTPWRNMSDIDVYESGKKKETSSELIVVASLIDKLPNLGGMARTCEIFGVQTYVIDSLRHLQDRQFQTLSVSAERWVNVEEVRPGQPLKDYLTRKKADGYAVVAAEQTSTSCQLQSFKFPKKTLLLLGHEKEGIPCDLLPMMDHCVEIPQQGVVRSLNVHVTAAIFVWEYARQNVL